MTQCEIRPALPRDVPMIPDHVFQRSCHSFVLTVDGIDLGVGGFENVSLGHLLQAWMIPFEDLEGHAITVVRTVRAKISERFRREPGLIRIQTLAHELDASACRFALACGFTPESIMEGAAPDGHGVVMFRILKGH